MNLPRLKEKRRDTPADSPRGVEDRLLARAVLQEFSKRRSNRGPYYCFAGNAKTIKAESFEIETNWRPSTDQEIGELRISPPV